MLCRLWPWRRCPEPEGDPADALMAALPAVFLAGVMFPSCRPRRKPLMRRRGGQAGGVSFQRRRLMRIARGKPPPNAVFLQP